MINIKKIRETTQRMVNLFYYVGLDGFFCKILTILPMNVLLDIFWINNFKYYKDSFYIFNKILIDNNIASKDKNILEIGSGNSVGWGYFFKGEGCKSYVASDKCRSSKMSKRALNMEKQILEQVKNIYPTLDYDELVQINTKEVIFKTTELRFETLDITQDKMLANHKFDLIISNAVLEHIYKNNLSDTIKNMNILLEGGGIMVHIVDLKDHFNTNFPFNFYKYSDHEWNRLVDNTPFYTNRLRLSDYINELKNNKFEIISIKKNTRHGSTTRLKIHPEFKNKYDNNELEITSCILIVRKSMF